MRRREFITLLDNAGAESARLCAVVDEIVATHPRSCNQSLDAGLGCANARGA